MSDARDRGGHYIAGDWRDSASGACIAVEDPATGEVIAEVAEAGAAEIDAAVSAAHGVFRARTLIDMPPFERGLMLHRVADDLESRREAIARTVCLDTGKAISVAREEVGTAVRYLRYYAGLADKVEGRSIPRGGGLVDFTIRSPFGVSGQVVPWNFPLELTARSLACAIATANCAVIKSPELAPLSGIEVAKACEAAGVPTGAVSILTGYGAVAGKALVTHPLVRHIVFTGSLATGRDVLRSAAERVVPCIMELGGKSAAIVYPDADLDLVVEAVKSGAFLNAGQNCNAMTRLLVHEAVAGEVLDRVEAMVAALRLGPGIEDNDITALISRQQLKRVDDAYRGALDDGARLVVGGGALLDRPGNFMPATLFADVRPETALGQHEVFGPVLAVTTFKTAEEAVAIANGTDQGLASGLFTRDLDLGMWTAEHLWSGQVYLNGWFVGGIETPFGGVNQSGYGREKGQEALEGYVQTRNIGIKVSARPNLPPRTI
ncbi:aldehyde dehydrogenase family protein [Phenylobacterium sp.]|uniref:aldehyde dehydrogenase family protein n=1 Tax=Phenylobacterium sp. TaxID=1871053 RepID=UPI001203DCE7|nr:aldehyde dehydrogenase family protein [Phenylobacterium sp.]THD64474.1 MAG: aldehyde dehydrogenase family protein [Phenylobacterium sp.]